jgi:hypothetical protein
MSGFDAAPVMAGLMDFQQATVEHVVDRFYGSEPTRRFLVADETGLGKSLIARGVIAKTVERFHQLDDVDRIDVVYVCSNADIAAQNVARLKVTADESVKLSSRLTLLAKHAAQFDRAGVDGHKPVNLVAFTPGTSFDRGWRTGKAEERAMLYLLLEQARSWDGWTRRAAQRALQGTVSTPDRFARVVEELRSQLAGRIDAEISADFVKFADERGVLDRFESVLSQIGRRSILPADLRQECFETVGELRTALALAGVRRLQPELVILDEFQRFRHLLDPETGSEAAELAHHLFNFGDDYVAAVLAAIDTLDNEPNLKAELAKADIILLMPHISGHAPIGTKTELKSIKDLKGKSLRTYGGVRTQFYTNIGGNPIFMSFADMYEAMNRGTVDALGAYRLHFAAGVPSGPRYDLMSSQSVLLHR